MRQMYQFDWNNMVLTEIVAHTIKNPFHTTVVDYDKDFNPITKDVKEPELLIVKDHGTYIMSASDKSLYLNPKDKEDKSQKVVYAKGHNPNTDEDYYVGGDDYGVGIPVDWAKTAIAKQRDMIITVTDKSISFELGGK